ncbi:MAG: hypothetical protein K1X89_22990 [Myxococcaceae bacterium]|nr:hypothetical protein [Myxococcaceae bacterium]
MTSRLRFLALLALAACSSKDPGSTECVDDSACQLTATCVNGVCTGCPTCSDGTECVRGSCLPHACGEVACGAGQVCKNGGCLEPECVGVNCSGAEVCSKGVCYPRSCEGQACGSTEICVNDACVKLGCQGISCSDAETCVHGACAPKVCNGQRCADGAVCENGLCVTERCFGVQCPVGTGCLGGLCLPTACDGGACPGRQLCVGGTCQDQTCNGLHCSGEDAGARCAGGACVACAGPEKNCHDGLDDDCDGLTDCADSDCDQTACDDGDACTTGELCTAGACGGGGRRNCSAPPGICFDSVGVCDSASGSCVYSPKPAGALCESSSSCVSGKTCDGAGACDGGTAAMCNTPPGPCFAPAGTCNTQDGGCVYMPKAMGTACDDGNACTTGTTCNAQGQCAGGTAVTCTASPGPCFAATGTCNPADAGCSYPQKGTGTACTTSNPCVSGATCNAAGVCSGGSVCPNTNTCQTVACVGNKCVATAKGDGASCGTAAASRCCNGSCVDISSNTANCGGCGTKCASGRACQSISVTTGCTPHPASTTGRCVCAGATAECSRGQICRAGQTSYNNLCTPNGASNCAPGEKFVDVNFCPNYCSY